VRILAALVNPPGADPGLETVTLLNTGAAPAQLKSWRIVDRNGRNSRLPELELLAGETLRVRLREDGAQLSNEGGTIELQDAQGRRVHGVSYSKAQVREEGLTTVF
jgi:hypothetical protein